MNGYFDSLLAETTSAQAANTLFSARSGEYFGVLADDVYQNSPTAAFGAWTDLQEAKDNYSYESRMLDPEEANSLYGIKGRLKFDSPIREKAAQLMHQRKYGEIYRQQVLSQGTTMQNVSGFGVGMAASLLDPLNVASMFVPVVGEARLAQTLGSLGRFAKPAARGILGAAETGVVVAALQGPTALLLNEYQADYDMTTALRDTAFAAAAGGVLRVSMGGFGPKKPEGLIPEVVTGTRPETQLQMQAQAAADLAQGKPVTGPQALIGVDRNILRAEAENSPEVAASFPELQAEPRDPSKPNGVREAPGFYDPEFKLQPETKPVYTYFNQPAINPEVRDRVINNYLETSEPINGFLRGEVPGGQDVELDIAALDNVIETATEAEKSFTVYRVAEEGTYSSKGEIDKGYLSVVTNRADAEKFAEDIGFDNPTIYEITVPAGTKFAKLGEQAGYPYTSEILLPRGGTISKSNEGNWNYTLTDSPWRAPKVPKAQVPEGYTKVKIEVSETKKQGLDFEIVYREGEKNLELYAPEGSVTFDQAVDFLFNNNNLKRPINRWEFSGIRDFWSFLVEIGVKQEDLDPNILKTGSTVAGRELAGIQSNAIFLKNNPALILTNTYNMGDIYSKVGFDIPGLTTVPIRYKDVIIKTAKGTEYSMRVALTQRLLLVPEYAVFRHFVDFEKMSPEAAVNRLETMNDYQIDKFIENTKSLQEQTRILISKATEQIAKKAIIANQAFGDLHHKNYGIKIPFKEEAPFEALILDKGAAVTSERSAYDQAFGIVKKIASKEKLRDPKTGKVLEPADRQNEMARITREALLEKISKGKEDFIREQELRLAKEKIAKLEQDLANRKDESTWWQPGDGIPTEVAAKETVSQPKPGIADDLKGDIQKLAADTDDFIQRFKNEMSESDLNRLKEFDDIAKQAEQAKPGFLQAALCVVRNLK